MILLWDNTSGGIPAGWTCISCVGGDPFYQVFPRASSTYGGASSDADSVTHTGTATQTSNGASSPYKNNSGSLVPKDTHAHTWTFPTIFTADIKPPFKNLQFIKAYNPSTLPNGIIGIFDVTSTSNLPANWSNYTALNGNYLRGENVTSTGGA